MYLDLDVHVDFIKLISCLSKYYDLKDFFPYLYLILCYKKLENLLKGVYPIIFVSNISAAVLKQLLIM